MSCFFWDCGDKSHGRQRCCIVPMTQIHGCQLHRHRSQTLTPLSSFAVYPFQFSHSLLICSLISLQLVLFLAQYFDFSHKVEASTKAMFQPPSVPLQNCLYLCVLIKDNRKNNATDQCINSFLPSLFDYKSVFTSSFSEVLGAASHFCVQNCHISSSLNIFEKKRLSTPSILSYPPKIDFIPKLYASLCVRVRVWGCMQRLVDGIAYRQFY